MRIVWTALLVTCALAGCGVHWIYDKPDVTPDQLARDKGACLQETPAAGLFAQIFREDPVDREVFNRCMQRRGYSVRGED
jgi:hypothetical protein